MDSSVTRNRLSSFYHTAEELGLYVPDEYVLEAPYRDAAAARIMTEKLLDLRTPPTCICYQDDFSAFGGMNAIMERGLKIPEDVSVAGYDGIRAGMHIEPQLTTVKQDTARLGRCAAEKLISLIEHPKTTLVDKFSVDGVLFKGGSVGRNREC